MTQMRALVASLESALAFVRALTDALPTVTQLLASSTVSDVHDAIGLLISFSKFGIAGSRAALRKMLPLVFSPDQGLCRTVISIYLQTPKRVLTMRLAAHATHIQ